LDSCESNKYRKEPHIERIAQLEQLNGYAERFIRTLKGEEVYLREYEDIHDARVHIERFIEDVYMRRRVHSALGYLTPAEFEEMLHL